MSRRGFFAWLDSIVSGRMVVTVLALEALLLGVENTLTFPLSVPYMRKLTGHPYIDMCAFCSADRVRENLDAFGDAGRSLQLWLMPTIDVAIPVLSAAFGVVTLTFLGRGLPLRVARWLRLLPIAAMALDFVENAGIVALVVTYPRDSRVLAALTGAVSGVKFCAYGATLLAIVALLVARVARGGSRASGRSAASGSAAPGRIDGPDAA